MRIEPLSKQHIRDAFDCGKPSLNDFLRQLASQHDKKGIGKTFVAVAGDDPRVLGYYTLAAGRIALEQIPPEQAKKLPRHPVPVVLLGRLAVDLSQQGTGLGTRLLMNAFARVRKIAAQAGVHAVEVDALDEPAARFYEKFGFTRLLDNPRHLYLPIKTIEALQLDPEDV